MVAKTATTVSGHGPVSVMSRDQDENLQFPGETASAMTER